MGRTVTIGLLSALAPLGAGCGDVDCEGTYRLGGGFTAKEEAQIRKSLQRWSDWSGKPAVLSPDGVCPIERRSIPDPAPDQAKVVHEEREKEQQR